MFIENLKKEIRKIFIKNIKKQYTNDTFLTQEEIDMIFQITNALEK